MLTNADACIQEGEREREDKRRRKKEKEERKAAKEAARAGKPAAAEADGGFQVLPLYCYGYYYFN